MVRDHQIYSERLTQRVNELFHDLTEHEYDKKYQKIFESEKERLQKIWQEFIASKHSLRILDFGTGTGYVPLTIGQFLNNKDICYCLDISTNILKKAKKKISEIHQAKNFKYLKNTGCRLPFKEKSLDVIILNSVLHHLNKHKKYLKEFDRVLKPEGLLIITHEPNSNFYKNSFLRNQFLVLNKFSKLEKLPLKLFSATPLWDPDHITATQEINKTLLKEKIISHPLEISDVLRIVDIRDRDGFNPKKLLPGYEILFLDTYDHLHWINKNYPNSKVIRWYDSIMKKFAPNNGATFSLVLQKG